MITKPTKSSKNKISKSQDINTHNMILTRIPFLIKYHSKQEKKNEFFQFENTSKTRINLAQQQAITETTFLGKRKQHQTGEF